MVLHKILETALSPIPLSLFYLTLGLGLGLGLVHCSKMCPSDSPRQEEPVESDILINLHSILEMATNHHKSMKMLQGSPTVLMTQSTINALFKMERTSFRTKWMREMKTMTPEDVWPVHIDDSKTPLWILYSSQASRDLRGIITHQDDLVKDIFLYDKDDSPLDLLNVMNDTDRERPTRFFMGNEEPRSNYHYFQSRRVLNLGDWANILDAQTKQFSYPRNSATREFINTMEMQIVSKYENVRRNSLINPFFLPWDRRIAADFTWAPTTVVHEFAAYSVKFAESRSVELKPASYFKYEAELDEEELEGYKREISFRESPGMEDKVETWNRVQTGWSPRASSLTPSPPKGGDDRIRFENSPGDSDEYVAPSATCTKGFRYDVKNRFAKTVNKKKRSTTYNPLYNPMDAWRLSASESSEEEQDENESEVGIATIKKDTERLPQDDEEMDEDDRCARRRDREVVTLDESPRDEKDNSPIETKSLRNRQSRSRSRSTEIGVATEVMTTPNDELSIEVKIKMDLYSAESYSYHHAMSLSENTRQRRKEKPEDAIAIAQWWQLTEQKRWPRRRKRIQRKTQRMQRQLNRTAQMEKRSGQPRLEAHQGAQPLLQRLQSLRHLPHQLNSQRDCTKRTRLLQQ